MKLFIEIQNDSSFEIKVNNHNTLLKIKQKIEKSHHIPVSQQRIIFDGISILRKDLNLQQCQIFNKSRIQINVSPNHSPIHNNNDQTQECLGSSISAEEYFKMQGWHLTTEELNKIYSYRPETNQQSAEGNLSGKLLQISSSQDQIIKSQQDSVHQQPSSSKSQFMITVFVVSSSGEKKAVTVARKARVSVLKKMLNLPKVRVLFIHKGRVLNQSKSFFTGRVGNNDTIEIEAHNS